MGDGWPGSYPRFGDRVTSGRCGALFSQSFCQARQAAIAFEARRSLHGDTAVRGALSSVSAPRLASGACAYEASPVDGRSDAASTTTSAVMLTTRRTLAVGSMICTGLAAPSRIGPTVMPLPAATFNRL